jgi:hypothetical protein
MVYVIQVCRQLSGRARKLSCSTHNFKVYWYKNVRCIPQNLWYRTGPDRTGLALTQLLLRPIHITHYIISVVKHISEIWQVGLQRSLTKYFQDLLLFSAHKLKIIHTKQMPIIPFCGVDRIRVGKPVTDISTPAHQHTSTPKNQHTNLYTLSS